MPTASPGASSRAEVIDHPARRHLDRVREASENLLVRQQALVLQLVAEFAERDRLDAALGAVVNLLHHRFGARRVSIGTLDGERMSLRAISQQARVDANTGEVDLLLAVLREARARDRVSRVDRTGADPERLAAHRALCAGLVEPQVVSVPMCRGGRFVAGLCLEFDGAPPVSSLTLVLFERIGALLAPLVETGLRAERGAVHRVLDTLRERLGTAAEPRELAALTLGGGGAALLLGLALLPASHVVVATAELEPIERRVVTAPQEGFIERVAVEVGDRVERGALLLSLAGDELALEASRWRGELRRHATEMRAAMAAGDRKEIAVLRARRRQAETELELVQRRLERSRVLAPEAGVVVSGELTQLTGAAIERGQSLLEIAPEEGYRVYLMVDERDVGWIEPGQPGRLKLDAGSGPPLELDTVAIHPVSVAEEGRNRFRVEAALRREDVALLPGQTGVARVEVGRARLGWIWTHRFTDWLAGTAWRWLG